MEWNGARLKALEKHLTGAIPFSSYILTFISLSFQTFFEIQR